MTIKDSIFILGAGSSNEYGMPLWADLAQEMKNTLNKYKCKDLANALAKRGHRILLNEEYICVILNQLLADIVAGKISTTIDEAITARLIELGGKDGMIKDGDKPMAKMTDFETFFWFVMYIVFKERMNTLDGSIESDIDTFMRTRVAKQKGWIKLMDVFNTEDSFTSFKNNNNMIIDFNYGDVFYASFAFLTLEKTSQLDNVNSEIERLGHEKDKKIEKREHLTNQNPRSYHEQRIDPDPATAPIGQCKRQGIHNAGA